MKTLFLSILILFLPLFGLAKEVSEEPHDKTILEYKEAIRMRPNDSKPYYDLGNAYYKAKLYSEALENFQKAIKLYREQGDYGTAIEIELLVGKLLNEQLKDLGKKVDVLEDKVSGIEKKVEENSYNISIIIKNLKENGVLIKQKDRQKTE